MDDTALTYIRVKNDNLEIAIKGSEHFISDCIKGNEIIIALLKKFITTTDTIPKSEKGPSESTNSNESPVKTLTIKEILEKDFTIWKKAITDTTDDSVIFVIAGYYLQLRNRDNYFTTKGVFKFLYQHGILLQDVSYCESHSLEVKNIVKVGTINKQIKFRVHDEALKILHEILVYGQS